MKILEKTKKIIELLGFENFDISFDEKSKKISLIINDSEILKEISSVSSILEPLEYIINLIFQKQIDDRILLDINNYRKEREQLIIELAKAAARKVLLTKEKVELPAMNSFERRLVHLEIAKIPNLSTESIGLNMNKERRVIVKILEQ